MHAAACMGTHCKVQCYSERSVLCMQLRAWVHTVDEQLCLFSIHTA
jgi:hypothetical protein